MLLTLAGSKIRARLAVLAASTLLFVGACGSDVEPVPTGPPRFTEVASAWGLSFLHGRGATAAKHVYETMGGGAALVDVDADGDLDVFVVDGTTGSGRGNRLFRNDGERFVDVTEGSGLQRAAIGMGCVASDFDNDGDQDLYVCEYGENRLYRNDGTGHFEDVTEAAGVVDPRWSVSAAFVDVDEDGWLDLYVANYLEYDVATAQPCFVQGRLIPIHCPPKEYSGAHDSLFRNRGDGSFEDISEASGIRAVTPGKGLGLVALDANDDGHADLYVANDSVANLLFEGDGNGRFIDRSAELGVALSGEGNAEAGMGIAVGDYDADGDLDLFVTNFMNETNTLYRNEDGRGFQDVTVAASLSGVSRPFVGFGTFFFDYDNDGWLDLFVTNGHVDDNIADYWPAITYAEPDLLLRGGAEGRFTNVSLESGDYFSQKRVGRGASVGDIDGDGDLDVLVTHSGDRLVLLRNDGGSRRHYLRVKLKGTTSNRDGLGARVSIESGGRRQIRELISGGSYACDSERVLHFGLGDAKSVERLEIRWPSGHRQFLEGVKADQTLEIVEDGER